MAQSTRQFGLVIVGGGPAGIAPLLAAHRNGQLEGLLTEGVAIVERSEAIGNGSLGSYAINSDSSGTTFVDCLRSPERTPLTKLYDHPLARVLSSAGDAAVPLTDAGAFLKLVGDTVREMIQANPACEVLTAHEALRLQRTNNGWDIHVRGRDGGDRKLGARNVLLSTGAAQPSERLQVEAVGGMSISSLCGNRLLQSGEVLTSRGLSEVERRLASSKRPRVAVIGGSTSALAVCHALLNRLPNVSFGERSVTLLHRNELRIYYPDIKSALIDGYTEFTENDICPVSGRVYRLAGFRLDSRELVMRARGIGKRAPEPRLALHRLVQGSDPQALGILEAADIVVAALGYRPRAILVTDPDGREVGLKAATGFRQPLVDDRCRVLAADGSSINGLFGIGLAAGFVPSGSLGGEPSFRGQANGLWLWQSDVGLRIVEAVRSPVAKRIRRHAGDESFGAVDGLSSPSDLSDTASSFLASVESVDQ